MVKKTIRRFTVSIPTDEVEVMLTRRFVRDVHGVEYPVDQEIQVPRRRTEVREVECTMREDAPQHAEDEQWMLAQCPAGSIIEHMQDIVTLVEED